MPIDEQLVDDLILSLAKSRWQKTAMIIGKVLRQIDPEGGDTVAAEIAQRIVHLVSANRLEAQGNLSRWRFSEVRLPTTPTRGFALRLVLVAVVVMCVSIWSPFLCWRSMFGCWPPWEVGWAAWFSLVGRLASGPFAFFLAVLSDDNGPDVGIFLVNTVIVFTLLSPWVYLFFRRQSILALLFGTAFWLLGGHHYSIWIYI